MTKRIAAKNAGRLPSNDDNPDRPTLEKDETANPGAVAQVLVALAHAIGDAHKAGMPHDNVKPSNILFDNEENPAVPELIKDLSNVDAKVRRKAASALGRMGPAAKQALPRLQHMMNCDDDMQARTLARAAFGRLIRAKHGDISNKDVNNVSDDVDESERQRHLVEPRQEPRIKKASRPEDEQRAEHLDGLLATVPKDAPYEEKAAKLAGLNHDVRQRIAAELAPALNKHIHSMPHDSYDQKKELARWVNEELRRFDLAIKCPKTGQPSILLADTGNHPEVGRFQLEHKSAEGKRVRSLSTPQLPHLELMEAASRREALREWHQRVGRPRGSSSRA